MTRLFGRLCPSLSEETRKLLDGLPHLIDKTFPLPARFRAALPQNVAELSRLLTSERSERGASYLGRPVLLSAYLRYYLPWNIYRLCRLLSALSLELKAHDAINDLGAGPLTLAASLWISRPELRNIPLEFRCLDRTSAVLDAGKKFFAALTASHSPACPWIIKTIRGEIRSFASQSKGLSVEIRGKSAALTTAVNVFNELFWNLSPTDTEGLKRFARNQARLLSALTRDSNAKNSGAEEPGLILVVEPGIPRSGEFISLLRSSLMEEGRFPLSPCTHQDACPMPGGKSEKSGKSKWCHFAFDTNDAPKELHRLSAASKIPKERAVLTFILAGPVTGENNGQNGGKPKQEIEKIRMISDCFPVQGNPGEKACRKNLWGRYGCSRHGLVLVTGNRKSLEASPSGALEEASLRNCKRDLKSGAIVVPKP